jgi:hypothetical protein
MDDLTNFDSTDPTEITAAIRALAVAVKRLEERLAALVADSDNLKDKADK